jgi:hypothetical protein
MATIEQPRRMVTRGRVVLTVLGLAAVGAVVWWIVQLLTPPQMGADEQVFDSVDALFTAVTARDDKLLGESERRLHAHRDAGKLPAEAADHLDDIIRQARAGDWQPAAERLYRFMHAQQREGVRERSGKHRKKGGAPGSKH